MAQGSLKSPRPPVLLLPTSLLPLVPGCSLSDSLVIPASFGPPFSILWSHLSYLPGRDALEKRGATCSIKGIQ